jgi:hypothetical protein
MATYRPSFVDVSGLTSGISRGLQVAAQLKKQQDALAESSVDEFMKTYQPGKLRPMDIPDFTKSYTDYKQAALNYSRLNRGGGKPEQLAVAKAVMDKQLGNLNSVYSSSASAAEKQAEYAEYLKMAATKGYAIPNEVSQTINTLSSAPVSSFDVSKIPSAYTFEIVPKNIDWTDIGKQLDAIGAGEEIMSERVPFVFIEKGLDGKPIYADRVIEYSGRQPKNTVEGLISLGQSNPNISNSAKKDYELLIQGIQNGSKGSLDRFNEIKGYFKSVQSEKDLLPEMVLGLTLYRKKPQKETTDTKAAEAAYRAQVDRKNIGLKEKSVAISAQRVAKMGQSSGSKKGIEVISHPYNTITAIKDTYGGQTAPQDVTREMQKYTIPGSFGGKEIIERAQYNPVTNEFIIETLSRKGATALKLDADATENVIVENSGEYSSRTQDVQGAPYSQKQTGPKPSKGVGPLGLDLPVRK